MRYVSLSGCGHQSPVQYDTASLESNSEARKFRAHAANLLRRRELNAPLANISSSHGWCCES